MDAENPSFLVMLRGHLLVDSERLSLGGSGPWTLDRTSQVKVCCPVIVCAFDAQKFVVDAEGIGVDSLPSGREGVFVSYAYAWDPSLEGKTLGVRLVPDMKVGNSGS